jgi:hypothetical protein
MSLINDALKRARQKKPESAPGSATPLQPVENTSPPRRLSVLVIPVALLAAGLAGWFFWQWWNQPTEVVKVASAPSAATNRAAASNTIAARLTGALTTTSNVVQSVNRLRADADAAFQTNLVSAPVPAKTVATSAVEMPTVATPAPGKGSNTVAASVPEPTTQSISPLPQTRSGAFPSLTVQAIYFRLSKPSVLINNRTLYIGDEIEGARVVGIERYTVKLEMGGKTKELTIK